MTKVKQGYLWGGFLLLIAGIIWLGTLPSIYIHNEALRRAPIMYLDTLEKSYIHKTKALRIYMPIALKCNSNEKK